MTHNNPYDYDISCPQGKDAANGDRRAHDEREVIRARMKKARSAGLGVERLSLEAQEALFGHPLFARSASLALYYAIKGEIGTEFLLARALEAHKAVYLPRILGAGEMQFARILSLEDLEPGQFGTRQPRGRGLGPDKFAPDLMIVPGLAFDRKGHRLGYGGGYYDRFIAQRAFAWPLAGLCFAFQIIGQIPAKPWDLRLDYLFDENGCYTVGGR